MDLTEADEGIRDWANQQGTEFVPMFGWRQAHPPSGLGTVNGDGECVMLTGRTPAQHISKAPACSVEQIVGTLEHTAADLLVKPRYLMGFNEPYDVSHPWANISAAEAVEMWRSAAHPTHPRSVGARTFSCKCSRLSLHAAVHMPPTRAACVPS